MKNSSKMKKIELAEIVERILETGIRWLTAIFLKEKNYQAT